ncbi:ABC transporter permease [uncultured Bacteroides sp.]|uniref:ABC transporter permease n=1 Tax=uncultured Bacteroides sp. TaxID=162156 RepID=UPI002731D4B7|nr:ABC transporter permease [uncultured Bacteroides sp.]
MSRNSLLYAVIAVHFMLGAGLFVICMNYRMTSRELLEEARLKSMEGLISVEEINGWSEDAYSISYDTYLRMSTEAYTEDLEILLTEMFHAGVFLIKTEEDYMTPQWDVYFMNDSLFAYLYQMPRKEGVVYVGKEAYERLVTVWEALKESEAYSTILFTEGEFYIEGDMLMVDGKSHPYEVVMPVGEDSNLPYFQDFQDFQDDSAKQYYEHDMTAAIIFPLEDAWVPVSLGGPVPTRSFLIYRYKNTEHRDDLIAQQLRLINAETGSNGYFTVPDAYKELKRQMDDYNTDMNRWLLAAVSVILLAGVGSMGTMFLLLNKRRHLLAVSVACGSTIRRLTAETIAENFAVLFIGGVLGILISPLLKKVVVYQGELRLNMAGIGIVCAAAFVFSVVSVLAGMHEIKAGNVAATLKEEG